MPNSSIKSDTATSVLSTYFLPFSDRSYTISYFFVEAARGPVTHQVVATTFRDQLQ